MDKFLKRHRLSEVTQEEINNQNSSVSIQEIELAVKTFPQRKLTSSDGLTGEFYTLKAEII